MRPGYFLLLCLVSITSSLAQSYTLRGSARANGGDCYELTPEAENQIGTIWCNSQLDLSKSFDIEFVINFGKLDNNGADGAIFIMQTLGTEALGNSGSTLGFGSFPISLGIEFDTFQNAGAEIDQFGDPAYDHIAVVSNGSVNHNHPTSLTRPVQALANSPNIEDGRDHIVRINWQSRLRQLDVYVDCQQRVRLENDVVNTIFGGQTLVWWGLSAATGQLANKQTVCLPEQRIINSNDVVDGDYIVCPGQSTTLVGHVSLDNVYQWTPAEGLDDPASRTPTVTPLQSTRYVVSYTNRCGIITRDTVQVVVPSTCTSIEVYLPEAFSPNRDGVNDLFVPVLSDSSLVNYSFTVYSRWGNVVFTTHTLADGWDGTHDGTPCLEGAYAYKLTLSYTTPTGLVNTIKQGSVLLAR